MGLYVTFVHIRAKLDNEKYWRCMWDETDETLPSRHMINRQTSPTPCPPPPASYDDVLWTNATGGFISPTRLSRGPSFKTEKKQTSLNIKFPSSDTLFLKKIFFELMKYNVKEQYCCKCKKWYLKIRKIALIYTSDVWKDGRTCFVYNWTFPD